MRFFQQVRFILPRFALSLQILNHISDFYMAENTSIIIKGARVNNLKNIDVEIPRNKLVVITGLSGSGKSSLAFDTLYAEGQRRYVESLSSYARQFLGASPNAISSKASRLPLPSSRKLVAAIRGPPWAPPPKYTNTCGCSMPVWGKPSARSADRK